MSIMFWDLFLLGLFFLFIVSFLYRKRKEIKREGLLYLYRTSWGIKLINKIGKKYEKTIKFLSYVSVGTGFILMGVMVYLFGRLVYIYAFHSEIVRAIKMPPIMPLVPYLPQMFKLDFLPPFYFSYWIIGLAIIAISHEFFHGIFAKVAKVRTKTTGFGFFPFFFPVFFAAFVELDEKIMQKRSNFKQMAVLSAGTFANILTALIGVFIMWGIFAISFHPYGVVADDYAYTAVPFSEIVSVSGIPFQELINDANSTEVDWKNFVTTDGQHYYKLKGVDADNGIMYLYYDAPAIRANLSGAIVEINDQPVRSLDELGKVLKQYSPGEKIDITTFDKKNLTTYSITLGENPSDGSAWLGVGFFDYGKQGVLAKISHFSTFYKNPHIYYQPNTPAAKFIYDFFWWLVLISFSVALINMLPMGIFDGGRFFYLTILSLTKSKKKAEKAFKWITWFFLFLLLVIMFFWGASFFR